MKDMIRISIVGFMIVFSFMLSGCVNTEELLVKFDAGNQTDIEEVIVGKGSILAEPIEPIYEGYIFIGWFVEDSEVKFDFDNGINESLVLKAEWEMIETSISYETNCDLIIDTISINISNVEDAYMIPVRTGYNFLGWFNENLDVKFEDNLLLEDDVMFYAKWELIQFEVTFIENGGNEIDDILVDFGTSFVEPDSPLKEDVIFLGWYLDYDLNFLYDFNYPVAMDLTLYAKWESRDLTITFVPSRPADEILTITEPLSQLLIDELNDLGYVFDNIFINVSSSYEAAANNILTGESDIAYLPSSTYALFMDEEEIDVILSAGWLKLNKDSIYPTDWNDGQPTLRSETEYSTHYRGLILAGTSTAARALAEKVNYGTPLVWDDVKDLNWCVRSETSTSGYIYPNVWLMNNFDGKTIDDLTNVYEIYSYSEILNELAVGTCDVGTVYSDARMYHENDWTGEFGRTESIWSETDVIGVTEKIMYDVLTVSTLTVTDELAAAIQQAYLNIALTPEGLEVMGIYNHQSYVIAYKEDYETTKLIQQMIQN